MRAPRVPRWRAALVSASLLAAVTLSSSCRGRTSQSLVYDFAQEFDVAEPLVERGLVEFGKPAARSLMIDGWHSQDERWGGETPFVWGLGTRSSLDVPLLAVRPITL